MKRFLAALLAALTLFTLTGCGKTENPAEPVTPGQAVVFYDGDYVVGGGTIL